MQLAFSVFLHCVWWSTINGQPSSTTVFPWNGAGTRLSPPNCRCNDAQTGNAQFSSSTPVQQYCTTTEETFDDICFLVNSLHSNQGLGTRPCGTNPEGENSSGQDPDSGQDSQFGSQQSASDGIRKKRADTISNTLDACLSNGSTVNVDAAKLGKLFSDYPSLGIRCFGRCPCTFHCPTRDTDPGYPTGSRNDGSDYLSQPFTLPPWDTGNQEGPSVDYDSNVDGYEGGPAGNNGQLNGNNWMTQRQGTPGGNVNTGNFRQNQNAMQSNTGPGTGYQQSATGSRESFPSASGSEALFANGFDPRRPRNQNLPFYGTRNAAQCRHMPCEQVAQFQTGFSSGRSDPRSQVSQPDRLGTAVPFEGNSGNSWNMQDNQRYGAASGNSYG